MLGTLVALGIMAFVVFEWIIWWWRFRNIETKVQRIEKFIEQDPWLKKGFENLKDLEESQKK